MKRKDCRTKYRFSNTNIQTPTPFLYERYKLPTDGLIDCSDRIQMAVTNLPTSHISSVEPEEISLGPRYVLQTIGPIESYWVFNDKTHLLEPEEKETYIIPTLSELYKDLTNVYYPEYTTKETALFDKSNNV